MFLDRMQAAARARRARVVFPERDEPRVAEAVGREMGATVTQSRDP